MSPGAPRFWSWSACYWSRLVLAFALIAPVSFLVSCSRCSSPTPLAELVKKSGVVQRDTNDAQRDWLTADLGVEFEMGEAVKTTKNASAELDLDDGSKLALQELTVVRFLEKEPGSKQQALGVELGTASLEAPAGGTVLETAFGVARLEGGTRVQLSRSQRSMRYDVLVGRALLEDAQGNQEQLEAGQSLEIAIGSAVLEPLSLGEDGEPAEQADAGGPIAASVEGAGVQLTRPGQVAENVAEGRIEVPEGSSFEVPEGATVQVSRGAHRARLQGQGSFVVGGGDQFVRASGGSFDVSSKGRMRVAVPGGFIVTSPGGSAQLTDRGDAGTEILGTAGNVTVEGDGSEVLQAGQTALLGRDGRIEVDKRGLSYADVEIAVGESVVIHDPSPPTAVRFTFGDQCSAGQITLDRGEPRVASGASGVALPLAAGSTDYELRCLQAGEPDSALAAKGRITVLTDAGTRAVPKEAPATYVEVNGRSYTVLYQNQLPRVSLSWSKAPEAQSYKLHLSGPSGSHVYQVSQPAYTFGSGRLGPGTHTVYFEGGGKVSRRTQMTIRFDNATPTASLKTPVATGAKPGSSVDIRGTALPGWSVLVQGKEVKTDASGAFSQPTTMPSGTQAIAVRLVHPKRGTHIYIRRAQGAQ